MFKIPVLSTCAIWPGTIRGENVRQSKAKVHDFHGQKHGLCSFFWKNTRNKDVLAGVICGLEINGLMHTQSVSTVVKVVLCTLL